LKAAAEESTQEGTEREELSSAHVERLEQSKEPMKAAEEELDVSPKLTKAEKRKQMRQVRRQERYEVVKELHECGLYIREIARRLKMNWRTVSKYVKADECPMYASGRKRPSKLDPYVDYMTQRWESGCHNATQIWREMRQLGFDGARRTVSEWATRQRKLLQSSDSGATSEKVVPWSARRASWLLVREKDELTEEDKQALERMKQADEKVAKAHILGQRFVSMIREREPEALLPWLDDATESGIEALNQFAKGLKQDSAAVTNALSLPWSNGQTEGQVNRLKLIKRQMYGRANFDLLRKRVIGGSVIWEPG
jgi:hypothetical protein